MGKYLFFSSITHFFRLEISQILENSKVVSVRGDGHCLIYAWEIALRASASSHFKLSYDILRSLIHMEFNKNLKKYCEFLVTENVNAAVAKYLNEKIYSQEIGDIIINVLSNATSTAAFIYSKSKSNEFLQTNFIEPQIEAINGEIHLVNTAENYEPIVARIFSELGQFLYHLWVSRYSRQGCYINLPTEDVEVKEKFHSECCTNI